MTREQCRQAARAITDSVNDPVLSVGVVPTGRLVDAARARNDPDDIDRAARVAVDVVGLVPDLAAPAEPASGRWDEFDAIRCEEPGGRPGV